MDLSVVGKSVTSRQGKSPAEQGAKGSRLKAEQARKLAEESCQASARAAAERIRSKKRIEREQQAALQAAAVAAKRKQAEDEQARTQRYERMRAEIYALNRLMRAVDGCRNRVHAAGEGTTIGQV